MDENKNTFVRLYGAERCRELIREETEKAVAALKPFDRPEFLRGIAEQLMNRDH